MTGGAFPLTSSLVMCDCLLSGAETTFVEPLAVDGMFVPSIEVGVGDSLRSGLLKWEAAFPNVYTYQWSMANSTSDVVEGYAYLQFRNCFSR